MTRSSSPKLGAYAVLAALGLTAALAAGRPELVALVAPFALALVVGLGTAREPRVDVKLSLDHDRVIEGSVVTASLTLEPAVSIDRLDVLLALPDGIELARGLGSPSLALPAKEGRELELPLRCRRWGAYLVGDILLRVEDRFGLLAFERRVERPLPLRVLPQPEALRSLVRPRETQLFVGDELSRRKGEGIEFADVRSFAHGDRVRDVNWRASARRGALLVSERHPERSTTVLLFLDSFAEAALGGRGTLDLAVRATASLARGYLGRRDRVGLVSFGGAPRWLTPSAGLVQLYRIVDALLETEIVLSYAWKGIEVLPPRTLPPNALVLAVTPLLDDRTIRALLDLRGRGFDVAVIEVSPLPFVGPPKTDEDELVLRLWRLIRDALRFQFERLGIAVVEWQEEAPLIEALEEVRAFRRYVRQARV